MSRGSFGETAGRPSAGQMAGTLLRGSAQSSPVPASRYFRWGSWQARPHRQTQRRGGIFANCTALHKVWHDGVAKGPKAAQKQVRDGYSKPAYGPRARKVYWANRADLDRDKDGTACET